MAIMEVAQLARVLKNAATVVETRNTIPVLSNVRLIEVDDGLQATTSDLDCEYRETIPLAQATEDAPLAVTVDAKRLASIAAALPQGSQVKMSMDSTRLAVSAGRSRYQLPVIDASDFPSMVGGEMVAMLGFECSALAKLFGQMIHAVSTEETRYYLNGIFLHEIDKRACLAATDGRRGMAMPLDKGWQGGAPDVILPRKAVTILQRLLSDMPGRAQLRWSTSKFCVEAGDFLFTGKVIDGTFPDYQRVFPQPECEPIRFEAAAMREALRRVKLVIEKNRAMRITVREGAISLQITADATGTAVEELPCDATGGVNEEMTVNPDFLGDAVNALEGVDAVCMHLLPAANQMLLHMGDLAGAREVIMGMRG
ncbi:DNA polymerase III subunit beta [Alteriqipengyuania sp.]|uniref:DNA polymerase III subunit beta n=1 Tax=Alteriqipengyuania sp. TaxID=2800692 RepID=UPI003514B489